MKKAFSLIEVIFVLVILGIVASISSQIIVQVYESYITQQAVYKVSTKTELAINQIVNRLTYSVIDSAIAKDPTDSTNYKLLKNLDPLDPNLTILEWIGYDTDSFSAGSTPYWSGVANYATATKIMFDTPGSQLGKVDTIIKNLSRNKVSLDGSVQLPAVIFRPRTSEGDDINGKCMGLVDNNTSCIYAVSENNATGFLFDDIHKSKIITERYQLAWSAYALVPTLNSNGLYNINLHYNYQPWENNETYDKNATSSLLISNVSVFKFAQSGGVIQLKLCASEDIGQRNSTTGKPVYISTCKEKVIIR